MYCFLNSILSALTQLNPITLAPNFLARSLASASSLFCSIWTLCSEEIGLVGSGEEEEEEEEKEGEDKEGEDRLERDVSGWSSSWCLILKHKRKAVSVVWNGIDARKVSLTFYAMYQF